MFEDDFIEDDILSCDELYIEDSPNYVLQNFPFLEDDKESLTDYELFCKGFEYLDEKKADKEDVPDLNNYYNKEEVNNLLDEKADITDIPDVSNFITKDVSNLTNYYDKDTTDDLLDEKADITDIPDVSNFITKDVSNLTNYYDKNTTDDLLDEKADITDIPDVSDFITKDVSDLTNYSKTSDFSTVAFSGNYNDLNNKPTLINYSASDIVNFLDNSWANNGESFAFVLPSGVKVLQLAVRNGTSLTLGTLPTELRPRNTFMCNAGNTASSGYVVINSNGSITVSSNIGTSGTVVFTAVYI